MGRDLHVEGSGGPAAYRGSGRWQVCRWGAAACTHEHKPRGAGLTPTLWIRIRQLNRTSPNRSGRANCAL
ncbi:hypothetical protein A8E25_02095 [Burkholderia cenocepacia]|nr:hypothetical protein BURCENK562V_C5317 [Burkholderia cenocepacia K56-2Valvano]ERI29471.1 hypothetical protein BURCENBC7_AP4079 [Burkholderia cenocepacia BC7]ONR65630.1 hypothetical protein A8E17_05145 [Burkholderia cenocepacia]ONR69589.1 hypothetical protein A8E18_19505 [Burkholderia cenocepacia]ONR78006.1 hypothetical protein A8E22_21190 [Burkholderia cenocepacia]